MSHHTLLHRAVRPLIRPLAGSRITPDTLTGARLATGLAAAACFAGGGPLMAPGAALFLVSTLLDRADGELARQSRRSSRIGARFDLVSDCLSTMAVFLGLGIGAAASLPLDPSLQPWIGPVLGLSGAVFTVVLFAQLHLLPHASGDGAGRPARRFDPDDAMLLVPIVVWCGGASWILLAAGVLTPLAALLVTAIRLTRPLKLAGAK